MGWQQGMGRRVVDGGVPQLMFKAITTSDMYNHTHKYRHTLVQTTRGHIETTTCTRKHCLHDPSQVAQLEKKKKETWALLSTAVWMRLGKSPQPSLHATHRQTLREKRRTNSFLLTEARDSQKTCATAKRVCMLCLPMLAFTHLLLKQQK